VKADRELGLGGKILLNASCKPQAKHLGKFFPEFNLHPLVGMDPIPTFFGTEVPCPGSDLAL
jgi:hypothetical protein